MTAAGPRKRAGRLTPALPAGRAGGVRPLTGARLSFPEQAVTPAMLDAARERGRRYGSDPPVEFVSAREYSRRVDRHAKFGVPMHIPSFCPWP